MQKEEHKKKIRKETTSSLQNLKKNIFSPLKNLKKKDLMINRVHRTA